MQPWFSEAKLGIFVHWGIYAVDGVGESWSFFGGDVPYETYMAQLNGFTASRYRPDDWAKLFRKAGAKYAVLTTKHHDGVALWDTACTDLSVPRRSPVARDLVGPFADALQPARPARRSVLLAQRLEPPRLPECPAVEAAQALGRQPLCDARTG